MNVAAVKTAQAGAVTWLGRMEYRQAWALQRGLAEARRAEQAPDTLLLVEHPHTFTLGRRGTPAHILADAEALQRRDVAVVPIDRGGDITYHGPGQLVAYPILQLARWGSDISLYVRLLEEVGIRTAATYGVTAERQHGNTGVWVGNDKLAAIGVRVSRWVTTHGLALNVAPDLSYFADIVPCGLYDRGVTSLERWLGVAPPLDEVRAELTQVFSDVFNLRLIEHSPADVRAWALPAPPEPSPSSVQLGRPHPRPLSWAERGDALGQELPKGTSFSPLRPGEGLGVRSVSPLHPGEGQGVRSL
ncbi:MAG TPA: lipoyl(octanoyl) transferase LipB [Chloroflexota bacterium]|nr:lipoyl(octanoyl) transferase LipB [Chloroflexota bacterium]